MSAVVRTALGIAAVLSVALGALTFVAFLVDAQRLGGDALSGYAQDGRYFVANHGQTTEVSRDDWEGNRFRERTVFVTHPVALVAMGYLLFGFVFPTIIGRRRPDTAARVAEVRASGAARASARCGGRVGRLRVSGPLLRVTAHPAGLVVEPLLMGARAILAREIQSVRPPSSARAGALEIVHSSPDVASPIVLAIAEASPLGEAVRALSS